ncbi:MAG: phage shock protein [Mucilaginibacter sp.]|nr:phage shock protein [Mucilaginibacter sp.]
MNKKLYRDEYHKVLGGVCSGLAEYFEMDVTIVRLLFAFTVIIMGVGIIPYIVLWIVLPRKGYIYNQYNNPTVDYTVPPQNPGDQFTPPPPPFEDPYRAYAGNPFESEPAGYMPPKQRSNAGLIVGIVLIFIGAAILIENYDLIPDFDFERLWPAVLVLIGAALIVSGQKREPWHRQDWQDPAKNENPAADNSSTTDNTTIIEP